MAAACVSAQVSHERGRARSDPTRDRMPWQPWSKLGRNDDARLMMSRFFAVFIYRFLMCAIVDAIDVHVMEYAPRGAR